MGKTPAHWAVIRKSIPILNYLIGKKSDINMGDFTGKTPLSYAILQEDDELIKVCFFLLVPS